MKQSKTFSLRSYFQHIHLMTARYMLSYLFRLFLIKILFIGGQYIPVFLS